jgi:hypothetical protein
MTLDELLARPGIYVVQMRLGIFFIEVEVDQTCHQLKPETFERDGVLPRDGWNNPENISAYGPLRRMPHPINLPSLHGLYVGQLDEEELAAFDAACIVGDARRVYENLLGVAKVHVGKL